MKNTRTLAIALGLTFTLVACGNRTTQDTNSAASTPESTEIPTIQTVLNLTPEAQGFVKTQLGTSKTITPDAQTYEAVIINAQSYTNQDLNVARTALQDHKRVIIDSSTGNVQDSQKIQNALVGGNIGSAAVVITNFGSGRYTVTPLERSSGVSKQGMDDQGSNSVQNVLGVE